MVKIEVHWMGLLSNVDSSILDLKLLHGFEIKYFTEDDALQHLLEVGKIKEPREIVKFYWDYSCINNDEKKLYYITRTETMDLDLSDSGRLNTMVVGETEGLFNKHIRKIIRLLRLLTDGDIRIPIDYNYYEYQGNIGSIYTRSTSSYISQVKFHLLKEDFKELDKLCNIQLPLTPSFLGLAFQNYERAYETQNKILAFLALMISLEILFNPDKYEMRYRISRNCAVLLGKTKKESDDIFKNIRRIYDIRSKIVHSGDVKKCDDEIIALTRHYVRESIKKMIEIGEDKNRILSKLNTLGFGEIQSRAQRMGVSAYNDASI